MDAGSSAVAPGPATPEFTSALLQSLVEGTRASNELAAADQHSFASTYPAYAATVKGLGERLTALLQALMQQQQGSAAAESFNGMDDDDRFEAVVDLSDRLLEATRTISCRKSRMLSAPGLGLCLASSTWLVLVLVC